ncbi:hypothetical protein RQM59_02490 [Flavobacteriaceae bacterium S356]|uniref:Type II secretion system protein n=1 Tax=Asprobacillus argus TaxID=3076534 RepID=A0ABU3LCG1_9FLAO|nr:hypothetical protein [Flavobacteriaceae bacterium S356]
MGTLKWNYRIKASSLVETIVATIIITIVFTIATVSVTRILKQSVDNSTHFIDTELQKLTYLQRNGLLKVPDVFEKGTWDIATKRITEQDISFIVFTAKNRQNQKTRIKKIVE